MPVRRVAPVAVVVLLMACNGTSAQDDDEPSDPVPVAAVITAAIRDVVDLPDPDDADNTGDPDDPDGPDDSDAEDADDKPVVYVFSLAEAGLSPEIQSDVFSAVRDHIDVRFADNRDEAYDEGTEEHSVIDGGVLLVIGEIPAEGDLVDVPIEIYYDADNHSKAVFTFAAADEDTWRVTETSQVSRDAAA